MNLKHVVVGLALLVMAACGGDSNGVSKSKMSSNTPDGVIMANVDALRRNDLADFLSNNFSEEQVQEMKTNWDEQRKEEPSDEEKAEFESNMAMLTADGAEDQIMGLIEPKLAEMKTQLPFLVMMGQTMGGQAIAANEDISDEEKDMAQKMLTAVADWANKTDIADPTLARKAVGIATSTARRLDLTTMEDVQALEFDELLGKGGLALGGTKEMLSVYGISLDDMFGSMKAKTVSNEGDSATVDLSFTFLGLEHSVPVEMTKHEGRWVSADAEKVISDFEE